MNFNQLLIENYYKTITEEREPPLNLPDLPSGPVSNQPIDIDDYVPDWHYFYPWGVINQGWFNTYPWGMPGRRPWRPYGYPAHYPEGYWRMKDWLRDRNAPRWT